MTCSIASVMGALGDRWGALIMRDLTLGLTRYDDLRRSTGVTNATLADRLKMLEQSGLIESVSISPAQTVTNIFRHREAEMSASCSKRWCRSATNGTWQGLTDRRYASSTVDPETTSD